MRGADRTRRAGLPAEDVLEWTVPTRCPRCGGADVETVHNEHRLGRLPLHATCSACGNEWDHSDRPNRAHRRTHSWHRHAS